MVESGRKQGRVHIIDMIPLKFEIYASFSLLLEGENRIKLFRDLRHFFFRIHAIFIDIYIDKSVGSRDDLLKADKAHIHPFSFWL